MADLTLSTAQVRYLLREITADEYNAAVRATPHLCPLYAMGDRRTGRELLTQAGRDMASAPFAAHPEQQALFRRFLAQQWAALHPAGSRSHARSHACCGESGDRRTAALPEQKPLPPQPPQPPSQLPTYLPSLNGLASTIVFVAQGHGAGAGGGKVARAQSPAESDAAAREWARGPLRPLWSFGRGALAELFAALPPAHAALFRRALDTSATMDLGREGGRQSAASAALSAATAGECAAGCAGAAWAASDGAPTHAGRRQAARRPGLHTASLLVGLHMTSLAIR
jgi:hypothetical protein